MRSIYARSAAGFLFALEVADQFLRAGAYRRVLVAAGDVHSSGLDFSPRGAAATPLFGDGAVVAVLLDAEGDGLLGSVIHTDASRFENFWCEFPSSRRRPTRFLPQDLALGKHYPSLDADAVRREGVQHMRAAVEEVLTKQYGEARRRAPVLLSTRVSRRGAGALPNISAWLRARPSAVSRKGTSRARRCRLRFAAHGRMETLEPETSSAWRLRARERTGAQLWFGCEPMTHANSRIVGVGRYLPEHVVTNQDLTRVMDTTDEWIQQRTGIRERHYIEEDTGAADLGVVAAREALDRAGLRADQMDLVLFATLSPDYDFPASACVLSRLLGLEAARPPSTSRTNAPASFTGSRSRTRSSRRGARVTSCWSAARSIRRASTSPRAAATSR